MLSLRKEMKSQFESSKSHTVLWTRIKKKLEEHGVKVTVTQVCSKFKTLKKEYKAVTDHNNISGNNKKEFKHMEYFADMFGQRAATKKPPHVIDSLEAKPAECSTQDKETTSQKKVPKKTPTPDKLESFISETREYRQRQERFQQEQSAAHAKQHEERLDVMKQFISIMAQSVEKKD